MNVRVDGTTLIEIFTYDYFGLLYLACALIKKLLFGVDFESKQNFKLSIVFRDKINQSVYVLWTNQGNIKNKEKN